RGAHGAGRRHHRADPRRRLLLGPAHGRRAARVDPGGHHLLVLRRLLRRGAHRGVGEELAARTSSCACTGATLLVVPAALATQLGLVARRTRAALITGGQRASWPVAEVRLVLDGGEVTTRASSRQAAPRSWAPSLSRAFFWPSIPSPSASSRWKASPSPG